MILETRGLTKQFGGLVALDLVDLSVQEEGISGLIGPNGSGKTTLFNLISGFLKPTSGNVLFKGRNIEGHKPHVIARKGIARTFQITNLFSDLTVLQNVVLGHTLHSGITPRQFFFSRETIPQHDIVKALKVLEFTGISHLKDEMAKSLPVGYQRILAVAIAVATEPQLLLLDEPLAGMNLSEVNTMSELMRSITDSGVSVLLVEHNVRAVMDLCNSITVLDFGKKIAEGSPDEILSNRDVIDAYLGEED
ncbi:ABC transporter ATP-binding protein [Chloroflexota bacterium]